MKTKHGKLFQVYFLLKIKYSQWTTMKTYLSWSLCRAVSNRVRGAPFRPVRAMAVDLFPQTMHCETILLFERVDYSSDTQTTETWGFIKPAQPFLFHLNTEKFKCSLLRKTSTDLIKVLKPLPHFCIGFSFVCIKNSTRHQFLVINLFA